MRKVKVVSAYVPLNVRHLTADQYHAYADRMFAALPPLSIARFQSDVTECWCYEFLKNIGGLAFVPATTVPADRYASPFDMVLSNIVQHQRTTWLMQAAELDPDADVLVWLDYAILKQGAWTGKPVIEEHIVDFCKAVAEYGRDDMPFPGIWPKGPIYDHADNWRFVGSTHVIPREYLSRVHEWYRHECRKFILRTKTVPLDLPIWAAVEENSGLPFVQYAANHDATQLTEFPRWNEF